MTTRIHILSDGFQSPNARAFAFPLLRHQVALAKQGVTLRFLAAETNELTECDLLITDSKYFSGSERGAPGYVTERLEAWRAKRDALLWFDTTDSAGWVFEGALAIAKAYYKNQILADRDHYLKPMHGRRLPSDFYHHEAGVCDEYPDAEPQVHDRNLLTRLHVGWNSGLADYSRYGPQRMAAYGRLRTPGLLRWPRRYTAAEDTRPNDVSCRFGTGYERASVAHQRLEIRRRLCDRMPTEKVRRGTYMHELETSRIVVSPFGLGEITLKDFETFLSGALLLKPDMDHMKTWPDFYSAGNTMRTFRWDLSDLNDVIDNALADPVSSARIAAAAQKRYASHLGDESGRELFVTRFRDIVNHALA
jgi:hypothetical protein